MATPRTVYPDNITMPVRWDEIRATFDYVLDALNRRDWDGQPIDVYLRSLFADNANLMIGNDIAYGGEAICEFHQKMWAQANRIKFTATKAFPGIFDFSHRMSALIEVMLLGNVEFERKSGDADTIEEEHHLEWVGKAYLELEQDQWKFRSLEIFLQRPFERCTSQEVANPPWSWDWFIQPDHPADQDVGVAKAPRGAESEAGSHDEGDGFDDAPTIMVDDEEEGEANTGGADDAHGEDEAKTGGADGADEEDEAKTCRTDVVDENKMDMDH